LSELEKNINENKQIIDINAEEITPEKWLE
jgi:hypothetical protein